MKEISILLPSLREELCKQRINEWQSTNFDVDYEIIVVSPFEVVGNKVIWLKDTPLFNVDIPTYRGSIHATNLASRIVQGKYMIYFSDDVKPTKSCLRNMINFMDEQKTHPFLGAFKMINKSGKEIGPFGVYGKFYACYGSISKDDLIILNDMLFKPEFKYSWGDCDLSLRVWEKKGEVKKCDNAIVIPEQINDDIYKEHRKNYFEYDFNILLGLWHKKLGQGLERKDGIVNRRLDVK